jgi:GTP-binding protein
LGQQFKLIDTGGLTLKNEPFQKNIQIQVEYAIEEADLILFMISNKEMVNADDYFIAKLLKKKKNKKVIVVVNKSENNDNTYENTYYSFGFGKPFYISAEHSIGTGDLLDEIVKHIKTSQQSKTTKNDNKSKKKKILNETELSLKKDNEEDNKSLNENMLNSLN